MTIAEIMEAVKELKVMELSELVKALEEEFGVSATPVAVAGAVAGMIKDGVPVEIQSVGAGAVNQAVKAIAISRGFLSPVGIDIVCIPSFADIVIDGEYRTAIRFSVVPR